MKWNDVELSWFLQLSYADRVANNATMIDNFPQRMERFLECISHVYIQQESFDGNDRAVGKKLVRDYHAEMTWKQKQLEQSRP